MDQDVSKEETSTQSRKEKISSFFSRWSFAFASGFGVVAIAFLFAPIVSYKTKVNGVKTEYFVNLIEYFTNGLPFNWSMWIVLGLLVLGVLLPAAASFFGSKPKIKESFMVGSALSYLVALCLLFLAREFFANNADSIANFHSASIGWGAGVAILFAALGAGSAAIAPYQSRPLSVSEIAEDGVLIAMAFGLNFIKIPLGASGGSANFQMLPLMLIALRHGPASGLICGGLLYGLLTCLTDGYGFATYPFDYLIGFGSVAIMGFFRPLVFGENQKGYNVKGEIFLLVGAILATAVRFIGSTVSSMVVYGYDLANAAIYNAIYIPVSGAIAIAVLMAIYGPLVRINKMFPVKKGLQ